MTTLAYPEGSGGLKSRYVDGVLCFYTPDGATLIYSIDPTNKKLTIASGATFALASGAITDISDTLLAAGDLAIADGKVLIGDATGKGVANTPTGDVTITNTGVTAVGAKKVTAAMQAVADGNIVIGAVGGAGAEQTLTGDVTVTNGGVTAIGALKVTAAMLATAVTTMVNGLRTYLVDGLLTIGTITISAAAEKFKTTTTAIFTIAGLSYSKVATDNLVFSAANTINGGGGSASLLWGIWVVQINAAGTVSTKPGAADMTYADEATAIAALPAVDASNVQLGYITVQALASVEWAATTSNLTVGAGAGNCTARAFYDLPGAKSIPAAL